MAATGLHGTDAVRTLVVNCAEAGSAQPNATSALGVIADQLTKAEEADFSTLMALTDEPDMTGTRGPDRTHRLGDGGK